MRKVLAILMMIVAAAVTPQAAFASEGEDGGLNPKEIIFHHLGDAYGWEVPFSHSHRIPLPVIVSDNAGGWHVFSSARVAGGGTYTTSDGITYTIAAGGDHAGKVVQLLPDGGEYKPWDISITKDVCALLIAALLVAWMAFALVSFYRRKALKAPRGVLGSCEALLGFIYSGVLENTLGTQAKKYAGYLLTVFFLIFFMNLLGLIVIFPGGANLTGNVAVTLVLATCTFLITNIKGNKHYWKDILWPDVPLWLKCPIPIMPVIEIFGIFTKPAALCVRLFANMVGGHMIVIVLTLLIFIFAKFGAAVLTATTVVSMAFSLFMLLLDVLVSFIQAYVFTMLSTLFISMAVCGGHEEEKLVAEK